MLFSCFTPTHDSRHLEDCYRSLLWQHDPNWEWVIVPNGQATIPARILRDRRVRIGQAPASDSVGALKKAACEQCRGQVLIEFDHDDLLAPGIFHKLRREYAKGAGFVYSDVAVFQEPDDTPSGYSGRHGWQNYPFKLFGREMVATRNFPITARSLCEIYYCPDHIRTWRADVYRAIGGHDPALAVCDDHDLLCRTYLCGTKFAGIPEPGYLYRKHQANTVKERSAKIQELTRSNRRKYLPALVQEWCRREGRERLVLEEVIDEGWNPETDAIHGLAVPDSSLGAVTLGPELATWDGRAWPEVFNAIYDALVPGGWILLSCPAYGPPGTVAPVTVERLRPLCDSSLARDCSFYRGRFQLVDDNLFYPSERHQRYNAPWLNAALCALKDQRQPGLQEI